MTPEEVKVSYAKLVETNPEITLKGAKLPYTSLNGNMFTCVGEHGVAIRLPAEARELFLQKTTELKHYLDISYEYVKTRKPKPTKKNK